MIVRGDGSLRRCRQRYDVTSELDAVVQQGTADMNDPAFSSNSIRRVSTGIRAGTATDARLTSVRIASVRVASVESQPARCRAV